MFIELKDAYQFIGGHLFGRLSFDNKYLVLEYSNRAGYKIKDDKDEFIWISKTAFRKYFRNTN